MMMMIYFMAEQSSKPGPGVTQMHHRNISFACCFRDSRLIPRQLVQVLCLCGAYSRPPPCSENRRFAEKRKPEPLIVIFDVVFDGLVSVVLWQIGSKHGVSTNVLLFDLGLLYHYYDVMSV